MSVTMPLNPPSRPKKLTNQIKEISYGGWCQGWASCQAENLERLSKKTIWILNLNHLVYRSVGCAWAHSSFFTRRSLFKFWYQKHQTHRIDYWNDAFLVFYDNERCWKLSRNNSVVFLLNWESSSGGLYYIYRVFYWRA